MKKDVFEKLLKIAGTKTARGTLLESDRIDQATLYEVQDALASLLVSLADTPERRRALASKFPATFRIRK